jgi:hypothetical protein
MRHFQHWIIDISRAMSAFLDTPAGALAYYNNVENPLEATKTAVYVAVTMTGDFFMASTAPPPHIPPFLPSSSPTPSSDLSLLHGLEPKMAHRDPPHFTVGGHRR